MSAPLTIGLTGRSGSGKTSVCGLLEHRGFAVIDADAAVKKIQSPGSECLQALADRFGADIIGPNGSLERAVLAKRCFGDPRQLQALGEIVYPPALAEIERQRRKCRARVCVIDAPTLFESGLWQRCDYTAAVVSGSAVLQRIVERDNLEPAAARRRLGSQLSDGFFKRNCDFIIDNSGTAAQLAAQVDDFAQKIENIANGKTEVQMDKEKTKAELLAENILAKSKSCFEMFTPEQRRHSDEFARGYMQFLNAAKTERESVAAGVKMLRECGFGEFDPKAKYAAGDKVYWVNREKALVAAVVGSDDIETGVNMIAAHVDSPHLDLKPRPLYEDSELALLKTHYYGGIKKYQWTAIPLAVHGVIFDKSGRKIEVCLGEDEDEPVVYITNLLPHLSASLNERRGGDVVKGEELNALAGCEPFPGDDIKDAVKLQTMKLLNEKYGFTEEDFSIAELALVPAQKARFVGLDRQLIAAYGHDDRVCAYPALVALLHAEKPRRTAVCIFADKEETGSNGATGLQCDYLKNFVTQLAHCVCANADVLTVLRNSQALSADVTAALDPIYADVSDKRNASFINHGPSVDKYGGSRGKYGCNDAPAEFMAKVRGMLDNAGICWQTGEMGKVDEGGGGTVAMFIAQMNVDVVDCGVPMLSMHSPCEIASAGDVFNFYRCCEEFYKLS